MVPRLIVLVLGSLVCSLVVLPLVGDPSWLKWLALLAFTGLGIPLSAWAAVRLLWFGRSPAAAWSAVVTALVVQVGLVAGVWMQHALTPRDIGSAIGRLARGEGMAPGGLGSSRLGGKLAYAWVKPVASEGTDDVAFVVRGADGNTWVGGERNANPPGRNGELVLIAYDDLGEVVRSLSFGRQGEATLLDATVSAAGEVAAVVRSKAQLTIDGKSFGAQGHETVWVFTLDANDKRTATLGLPFTDAVAASSEGRLWVAGDKQKPALLGGEKFDDRGLALVEMTGGRPTTKIVLPSQHARPTSLHVSGDRVWLTARISRDGDQLTAGPEVREAQDTPNTVMVTLDKASLEVRSSFMLGDVDVHQRATLGAADGELIVGATLPLSTADAPAEITVVDAAVERLGPLTVVLFQVSPLGELRWRSVLGNPKTVTATDDAVTPAVALARDEHGLLALVGATGGITAEVLTAAPSPSPSGEVYADAFAVRLSLAGQVAFVRGQGTAAAHERYKAAVSTPRGFVVAGTTQGEAELGGFALPAGEGDAASRQHAFVGLARIE